MLPKTLDQLKIRVGSVRGLSEVTNGVSNEVSNQGGGGGAPGAHPP
jgi:hypothetical protein